MNPHELLLRRPPAVNPHHDALRNSDGVPNGRLESGRRASVPMCKVTRGENAGRDQEHTLSPFGHSGSIAYSLFVRYAVRRVGLRGRSEPLGPVAQTTASATRNSEHGEGFGKGFGRGCGQGSWAYDGAERGRAWIEAGWLEVLGRRGAGNLDSVRRLPRSGTQKGF